MSNKIDLSIMLVEDDDVAAESVQRSLSKMGMDCPIIWARDGVEALDILRGDNVDQRAPRPRVILLDLNMPRMNGFEFLQHLRQDARLRDEIVFVLTTSDSDTDRTRAYHENIAGYMVKAAVGPQFSRLAQLLLSYQEAVRLP